MVGRACIAALCEHKVRQATERADAWPNWEDYGLVLPLAPRAPMEPENLRRSWAASAAAGLEGMRPHDMRHTCVSLLHLGVAPDVVKEIVGHSDIQVTMTIYAHTSLDGKQAALRKLGDALG
ncbi:tyrosine-type recombinase/integrase [Actinomadura sp. 6N118]|uniref:tyrosine-type recombinase/integrase n=1 Tax=Actinomadura sp. 6N118 TaxID=3375151 RepID=UPI0037B8FFA9